jgi:hypothetical protein
MRFAGMGENGALATKWQRSGRRMAYRRHALSETLMTATTRNPSPLPHHTTPRPMKGPDLLAMTTQTLPSITGTVAGHGRLPVLLGPDALWRWRLNAPVKGRRGHLCWNAGSVATSVAPVTTRSVLRPGYAVFESCFAPEPINVGRSRHTNSVFLRLCEVADPLAKNVLLCIYELVTKSVTHGSGEGSLGARCRETEVFAEVNDGRSVPATLWRASADATSVRGLVLVKALSGDWGASTDGRTTWCTFLIPAGRP